MQLLKPMWINHDDDKAIFGVDVHPDGSRFATGGQGQDSSGRVVIWNLLPVISQKAEQNEKVPKLLCQLDQHLGCVNSVRWSNSGNYLASAGDDKVIIIWQQSGYGGGTVFGSNVVNVESWRIVSTLRGHNGDILDVAWSPQDIWLASASVDNNVIIWNAAKWPEQVRVLKGHTGLVKGVAWDPIGRYLVSQADDKSMRIWRTSSWSTEQKITEPFAECGGTTTILRPSWSPDGQYLVSAHAMNNGGPTAQIIERDGWNTDKDFVGHRKAVTCVRFNPNILNKRDGKKSLQFCCIAIGSRDRSISIWFTSLKRPLVVIHDIFDDSVLDLSWSRCGKHLLAVSKDGTLGCFSFTEEEIGRVSSTEEMNKCHMKLYGSLELAVDSAVSTVIENPEFLKLQEAKKLEEQTPKKSVNEKRTLAPPGPTNKQIEMRTADGKRRITPMFIPPPPDGELSCKSADAESFSSSRQEKSTIVVEKVDGIVEPNISSPNKSSSKSNQGMPDVPAPKTGSCAPDLDAVPAGLSARMESKLEDQAYDKSTVPAATIPIKRKADETHLSSKRRRGRAHRPVQDKLSSEVGSGPSSFNSSRPQSPVNLPVEPRVKSTADVPSSVPSSMTSFSPVDLLGGAILPRTSRIQIPDKSSADISSAMLIIENNWKMSSADKGSCKGVPYLHKISRQDPGSSCSWVVYMTSEVAIATAASVGAAIACLDGSLHILHYDNGDHILPPMQLSSRPSQLFVQENYIVTLTTDATLSVWDFSIGKRVMRESIRHLVANRSAVKCIQLLEGEEKTERNPVVILKTGEAFAWLDGLDSWVNLGSCGNMTRLIDPQYTLVQPFNSSSLQNPLSKILSATGSFSGTSRFNSTTASGEVRRVLTESFLKRMLTSSKHLCSNADFRMWHKRLAKFYIAEGMEKELRKMFDDLLGPLYHSAENSISNSWQPKLMGVDKRDLLKEYLREVLIGEKSIHFQRLYTEYMDQVKGDDLDAI